MGRGSEGEGWGGGVRGRGGEGSERKRDVYITLLYLIISDVLADFGWVEDNLKGYLNVTSM